MKQNIYAFLVGFTFCMLLCIPIANYIEHQSFEHGKGKGYASGVLDSAAALEKEFGSIKYSNNNYEKVIFSIKTTEVVLVKVNDIKTVKVTSF